MKRSHSMTPAQSAIITQLKAEGFKVDQEEHSVVRMKRGNDVRLVQMNGAMKRGLGAR